MFFKYGKENFCLKKRSEEERRENVGDLDFLLRKMEDSFFYRMVFKRLLLSRSRKVYSIFLVSFIEEKEEENLVKCFCIG